MLRLIKAKEEKIKQRSFENLKVTPKLSKCTSEQEPCCGHGTLSRCSHSCSLSAAETTYIRCKDTLSFCSAAQLRAAAPLSSTSPTACHRVHTTPKCGMKAFDVSLILIHPKSSLCKRNTEAASEI